MIRNANLNSHSRGQSSALDVQMLCITSGNMSKNDLWIAATTFALDAVLITFDKDFEHLDKVYFEVKSF